MKKIYRHLTAMILAAVLLFPAMAYSLEKDPYLKADETWISISGTAVDTKPASFTLDYGDGLITVEMDGWDWYNKEFRVIEGDKVTVYGRIDDDLYETTTIEASSVYDENLNKYFYTNSADEEYDDDYDYWIVATEIVPGETIVRGAVTSVNGREFTLDTGPRRLTVDTSAMIYNPMDDMGYTRVDKGDYVSVSGDMDVDFWEGRELMADTIVVLEND